MVWVEGDVKYLQDPPGPSELGHCVQCVQTRGPTRPLLHAKFLASPRTTLRSTPRFTSHFPLTNSSCSSVRLKTPVNVSQ